VTREVLAHIGTFDLILLAGFVGDDDYLEESCPLEQRHGVGDRARGGSATVPAHHDAVKLERRFAAGVVYVLLPPETQISFHQFVGVYVIATPISLLSLVPGGLGVFETLVVALVPSTSKAALLGSLIAYRLIYFVLPLALAILLVAIYEMRRSSRGSDWPRRLPSVLTRNAKRDPGHRLALTGPPSVH
jgi:hypothetical protein